ncbi:TraB/GumN family protein [Oryzibacter oryziterrae]|uniref:TraB/GumN family protein n=1 Tax=Oryzibacter oryziterrae TaxID=2766474 RepID=UPI001F44A348|nr:TraB/GumN family protein [Oryzibacter oryziterrae]
MLQALLRHIAAAALAVTFSIAPALADPAMWAVHKGDITVTLFGSMHMVPPRTDWMTDKLEASLLASDKVWFETDVSGSTSLLPMVMAVMATKPAFLVRDVLTEAELERVATAVQPLNISKDTIGALPPWFASLILMQRQASMAGLTSGGPEAVLGSRAKNDAIAEDFFESNKEQIDLFAGEDRQSQTLMLHQIMDAIERKDTTVTDLLGLWLAGDVEGLWKLMVAQDDLSDPKLYDLFLKARNRKFADAVDALLKDECACKRSHLVVIGAAHLAGPDSVQSMLAAKGYAIERVQ